MRRVRETHAASKLFAGIPVSAREPEAESIGRRGSLEIMLQRSVAAVSRARVLYRGLGALNFWTRGTAAAPNQRARRRGSRNPLMGAAAKLGGETLRGGSCESALAGGGVPGEEFLLPRRGCPGSGSRARGAAGGEIGRARVASWWE